MESKPSRLDTAESPSLDSEKDTKSAKKKPSKDIAKSIDRLALFEKPPEAKNTKEADKEDGAPTPETSSEELTDQERQYVQQEIAKDHLESRPEADLETAVQLDPTVDFLQRLENGTDVETAFTEAASEAGLEEVLAEADAVQPEVDFDGSIDTSTEDEGEIDWRNPTASTGGGSGGMQPPRSGNETGGDFAAPPPNDGESNHNQATPLAAANVVTAPRSSRRGGDLLVGGVVGYLIGRRRGRIKTEKKLLPVQQKLERQVSQLEANITAKEQQLEVAKRKIVNNRSEQQPNRMQAGRQETRLGLEKPRRAEHLGHMVMTAEAPTKTRIIVERPNSIRQGFRAEEVKTMQRNELLELSEKIVVEGASLRRIYESHLIGEKQLRHLVGEYLAGKDIRKDLRKEMVEHEIDFERDPILRDRIRSQLSSKGGAGGLNELLASVGALPINETELDSRRQAANDKRSESIRQQKTQHQRRVVDTATGTAIVVLSVIIAILLMR